MCGVGQQETVHIYNLSRNGVSSAGSQWPVERDMTVSPLWLLNARAPWISSLGSLHFSSFLLGHVGMTGTVNYRLSGKQEAVSSLSLRPIPLLKPHVDNGVTFPTTAQGSRVAREQWRALMTVVG